METTYDEYLAAAATSTAFCRDWRTGQAFFNTLRELNAPLAEEVRGTVLDPFHDDERLPDFLEYVCDRWGDAE